jgi:amidase
MDFLRLDAHAQLEALNAGRISALDALNLAIARADTLGATLNAVVARRQNLAREEARRIDEGRSLGQPMGRLAGLPMTIKDSLDIEGLPASVGRADLLARQGPDADAVRRVRAEGAIVWGQTNTPLNAADWQTFNPLYGVTNNPWDLKRTPGGSSGGSAAALAAGISALEIGADIAGSLRIPAAFCGVLAHKPTFGAISQAGLSPPRLWIWTWPSSARWPARRETWNCCSRSSANAPSPQRRSRTCQACGSASGWMNRASNSIRKCGA